MGSRTTTSMSLAVLELLLDEHAVKFRMHAATGPC
jgi:hypothetical protein